MIKMFRKNQEGSVAVMVGVMLPVLIGFIGLALDVGNLVVVRTQMQNAVDAAVCAGCLKLSLPIPTGQAQASTEANAILTSNNFSPANATVTFTQDLVKNSANAPEINCTLTNNVPTYFIKVLGISTVSLTAYAEAIRESKLVSYPGGPFNYTVFSNKNLLLNGSQAIDDSVHTNGILTGNGSLTITGVAEGVQGVSLNGSYSVGSINAGPGQNISQNGSGNNPPESYNAKNIAMPDYSQQILSTPGLTQYSTSQTFNGSVNLTGNIYVNGDVTLNGSITDTGAILATGNITVNGTATISGTNQLFLYSSGGNITINGSSNFASGNSSVVIYAPNATNGNIIINGSSSINGYVIGNSITSNGSEDFDQTVSGKPFPITSIDLGTHAKLIS